MDNQEDRLHAAVVQRIGPVIPAIENYGYPHQVELALVDAVLSIRANYGKNVNTGVRGAVGRYKSQLGQGNCDDLRSLGAADASELARVLRNHQSSGGRLKTSLMVEVANRLVKAGVVTAADVRPRDREQRLAWCGVHGLGAVTWAYFGMLVGQPGVKVDRMIRRFVRDVLDDDLDDDTATNLIAAVAGRMQADVSHLDHAIWLYQRGVRESGT